MDPPVPLRKKGVSNGSTTMEEGGHGHVTDLPLRTLRCTTIIEEGEPLPRLEERGPEHQIRTVAAMEEREHKDQVLHCANAMKPWLSWRTLLSLSSSPLAKTLCHQQAPLRVAPQHGSGRETIVDIVAWISTFQDIPIVAV